MSAGHCAKSSLQMHPEISRRAPFSETNKKKGVKKPQSWATELIQNQLWDRRKRAWLAQLSKTKAEKK